MVASGLSSKRRALALLVSAGAGAAAAGVVIAWAHGSSDPLRAGPVAGLETVTLRNNKQPLTRGQLRVIVRWARGYRECARERGLRLNVPARRVNEVVMTRR